MNLLKLSKYIIISSFLTGIIISFLSTLNVLFFSGNIVEWNQAAKLLLESIFLLIPICAIFYFLETMIILPIYFFITRNPVFFKKFNFQRFHHYSCFICLAVLIIAIFFFIAYLENIEKIFMNSFGITGLCLLMLFCVILFLILGFKKFYNISTGFLLLSYFIFFSLSFWFSHNYFLNQLLLNHWITEVILFFATICFLSLQSLILILVHKKIINIKLFFSCVYLSFIVFIILLFFQKKVLDDSIVSLIYRDTVFQKIAIYLMQSHSKVYLDNHKENNHYKLVYSKTFSYPDIYLITIDSLKAEYFSHLKSLELVKNDSEIFTNCYSSKTYTVSSLNGLFTSKYFSNSFNSDLTFPQILSKIGYDTTAIFLDDPQKRLAGKNNTEPFVKGFLHIYIPSKSTYLSYKDYSLLSIFSKIINNHNMKKPNFVWIHLSELHTIKSTEIFYNIFDNKHFKNEYNKKLNSIDKSLSIIFKGIYNLNKYNNSLIIVTSDHGESIKERRQLFHIYGLYEEYVRVPLLIKFAKNIHLKNNKLVSLLDLYPTIIDYLNVKLLNYDIKGNSVLSNKENKFIINLLYLYDSGKVFNYNIYKSSFKDKKLLIEASIVDNRQNKLICNYYFNFCELYNLKSDSLETNNIILKKRKLAEFLKLQLNKSLFLNKKKILF